MDHQEPLPFFLHWLQSKEKDNHDQIAYLQQLQVHLSIPFASSTVITPSRPTLSIASAIS